MMAYVVTYIDYITTHILLLMDLHLVKKLLFEIFIPMNSHSAHVIFTMCLKTQKLTF